MYTECLPFTPMTPQHALSDDAACGYSGLGTAIHMSPAHLGQGKLCLSMQNYTTVPLLDSFQKQSYSKLLYTAVSLSPNILWYC